MSRPTTPVRLVIPLKPSDFAARKGRPRRAAWLCVAVLAAGLAPACSSSPATSSSGAASSTPTSQPSTQTTGGVTIPPLIGAPESLAIRQLAHDGLPRVRPSWAANLYFGSTRVLATSPPGGDLVRPGVVVTVYVSLGPEYILRGAASCSSGCVNGVVTVRMPDVCGLTFQEAATKLVAKDITLRPPGGNLNPQGRITSSVPAAGQRFIAYGSDAAREVVVTLATAPSGTASAGPSC
jgi:beta-lactam-binding protein with PASTA domain